MTAGKEARDSNRRPAQPSQEELDLASKIVEALRSAGISESEEASRRFVIRVSRALRSLRRLLGAKQERVADAAELTQNYVSKLESGKMSRGPTLDVLVRYANALDCEIQLSFSRRRTRDVLLTVTSAVEESIPSKVGELVTRSDDPGDLSEIFFSTRARPLFFHYSPQPKQLHCFEIDETKENILYSLSSMSHNFSKPIFLVAKPAFGYSPLRADEVVIAEMKPTARPFARHFMNLLRRK